MKFAKPIGLAFLFGGVWMPICIVVAIFAALTVFGLAAGAIYRATHPGASPCLELVVEKQLLPKDPLADRSEVRIRPGMRLRACPHV